MKIAVDFDGTLVEDRYPKIGKEKPYAFEVLKMFMERGYLLILWTSRMGSKLDDAIAFCNKRGIDFYAVNKNFYEEMPEDGYPRKIIADIFIDDRCIFADIDWQVIYHRVLELEATSAGG